MEHKKHLYKNNRNYKNDKKKQETKKIKTIQQKKVV